MRINKFVLENEHIAVTFLDIGASIYSFIYKAFQHNIVLTSRLLEDYTTAKGGYFGATIGRVAGRIGAGRFWLENKEYTLEVNEKETNSLHGGFASFAFKAFTIEEYSKSKIVFKYISPAGEAGSPGEVVLFVTYTLAQNSLCVHYRATTSAPTLLNITNHSYFNLNGAGLILDHLVKAEVGQYYEHDADQLNVVAHNAFNSPFDFRKGTLLKDVIFASEVASPPACGLDHLLVLRDGKFLLSGADLELEVQSNYAALQLYSTNFPADTLLTSGHQPSQYAALAIEPVDKVIKGEEAALVLRQEEEYSRTITYTLNKRKV